MFAKFVQTDNASSSIKTAILLVEQGHFFFGGLKFVRKLFEIFCERKIFKEFPVNFFTKIVARGNAVQILPNFPAKRLSIYRKKNFVTPFN